MSKASTFFLLILISLGIGCNKDESTPLPEVMTQLVGNWQFELGTLDFNKVDNWSETTMEVNIISDSSLIVKCFNQPSGRENIWPAESILYLNKSYSNQFIRNDEVGILVYSPEETYFIVVVYAPREWSYEDDCPNDVNQLICSEEGRWDFRISKL